MKLSKVFFSGMLAMLLVFGMVLAGCDNGSTDDDDDGDGDPIVPITQAEFAALLAEGGEISVPSGSDVTIPDDVSEEVTVYVSSGATVRDYWKIGDGNEIIVSAGASLRWGTGTANNLYLGDSSSAANLKLTSGTFKVIGKASDQADYELASGAAATAQKQNGEPLVVDTNQTFTVKGTLTIASAGNTDLASIKPTLSVHETGGKLVIENEGTLVLSSGALVVLGNGTSSIEKKTGGTITDNAGTYDGAQAGGIVGFVNSSHVTVTP
jgi:hypothetical protein